MGARALTWGENELAMRKDIAAAAAEMLEAAGCKEVRTYDGACMTSSACQNPSITYMALTARACDYAVEELKRGNL